jgi:hypothetical protein
MTINTNEPTIVLVNNELLIFRHYQVDVKDIKCPLQWQEKHESMFSTIGFWIRQIFRIVGSKIEIERTFSLAIIVITKYLLGIVIAENNNIMTCGDSMDKNGE